MAQSLGSTFETNEPGLSELLREVAAGLIQLPDFQRPWVWEDHRIRALLASVSLSYPIGAVMLMQVGGETRFAPEPVAGVDLARAVAPRKLILDGQQRLTSLFMTLMSKRPVRTRKQKDKEEEILRWYYLDMRRALAEDADHEDRLEAIVAVPADKVIRENFDRDIRLDLRDQKGELESHMFPLALMYDDVEANQWFMNYQDHHESQASTKFMFSFMQEIRQPFLQYKVPVIELTGGTRKEAVCQVFENVNMGGVPLTVFELVTASFAADDFRLRVEWEQRRSVGNAALKLVPIHSHEVLEGVDGDAFLQAVALFNTYKSHLGGVGAVGAKRKDILRLSLDEYRSSADAVHRGFLEASRLLIRNKVFRRRDLPYQSQLVALAAILAVLGDKADSDAAKNKLAQWYWCGVFGELYGGATEARFALDVQQVPAWVLGGLPPRTVEDANFAPTRLLTLQSRLSAAYKGMMAPLMSLGSRDLKTGDEIHVTTEMHDDVDIHHLFPKAYCQDQGYPETHWNSIVNKAPIVARTNRSIGRKAPSEYLGGMEKELSRSRVDEILRTHAIEPAAFRADDFHGFIRQRAGALLDLVSKAMGKPVVGRDSEETIKRFGGSI